nr:MAG TPA: hypothetical protein [Crassvirales sp.]
MNRRGGGYGSYIIYSIIYNILIRARKTNF